jgi:hypothetical protein
MTKGPNLWWSYDGEGSFSALPPGPFLLPAVAIALLFGFVRLFNWERPLTARDALGSIIDSPEYKQAKQEFLQLQAIFIECNRLGNEMDTYQFLRYRHLQQIAWIPGLTRWDYRD